MIHNDEDVTLGLSEHLTMNRLLRIGRYRFLVYFAGHQKLVKPSFLIEVMALECLHAPFGGHFDYEFQGIFTTFADRIFDTWKDPAGLGTPVSDMMTRDDVLL